MDARSQTTPPGAATLVAAGCALPFLAGAALPVSDGHIDAVGLPCPFAAATGVPCPLCGSSRAFALLMHGDPAFARYNLAVVVLAGVALLLALVSLAVPAPARRTWRAARGHVPAWPVAAALVAVPWLWAFQQRAWIT